MFSMGAPSISIALVALTILVGKAKADEECGVHDLFPKRSDGSWSYSVATIPDGCETVYLQFSSAEVGEKNSESKIRPPPPIGDLGASALAVALIGNTQVTTVWLGANEIGAVGAQALSVALKVNTVLKVLSVAGNSIGDAGVISLAEALKVNTVLSAFILRSNNFGPAGAAALGEALRVNTGLQQLYIHDNTLGEDGVIELSKALELNTVLSNLVLQNTGAGPEAAYAIGQMLKSNHNITSLDMQGNPIGVAGGMVMGDMLQVNSDLVSLNLQSTGIGVGSMRIADGIAKNTKLAKLILNSNGISSAGVAKLASALERNCDLTELGLRDNGGNEVEESVQKQIDLQLAINSDSTKRTAKQLQINPCYATSAEALCGGHGVLAIASEAQKTFSAGSGCVCTACTPGYSGTFCEVGPCEGKTSETTCNGRGMPFVSAATNEGADVDGVERAPFCKCKECTPWYRGDACEIYNPCGTYNDCEAIVGDFVMEHFLQLDLEYLATLGGRSVMDVLLLRRNAVIPGFDPKKDERIGFEDQDKHLKILVQPLEEDRRARFISSLNMAPQLVFSTGDAVLHFDDTVPLTVWGDSIHLPRAVIRYLISLGVDEPGDLMSVTENDVDYMRVGDSIPFDLHDEERVQRDNARDGAIPGASIGKHPFADTGSADGNFTEGGSAAQLKFVDIIRLVAAAEGMRALKPVEEHKTMMLADAARDEAEDTAATPTRPDSRNANSNSGNGRQTTKSWEAESKQKRKVFTRSRESDEL